MPGLSHESRALQEMNGQTQPGRCRRTQTIHVHGSVSAVSALQRQCQPWRVVGLMAKRWKYGG